MNKKNMKIVEWDNLTSEEQELVLAEYKKGWHFLLVWGPIIGAILFAFVSEFISPQITTNYGWLNISLKFALYSCAFKIAHSFHTKIVEPKVIKDLIKDLKKGI